MGTEDNETTWKELSLHCPNCGGIVRGYTNHEGMVKLQCRICGVNMVIKQMGRRHNRVDIFSATGKDRLND